MDPNVKTIARVGTSDWKLAGVGFALSGVLLLLMQSPLAGLPGIAERREAAIVVAGAFMLLGFVLLCVRSGVILDRQQRTITMWRGLLVPFYKAERPGSQAYFSQTHYVALSREMRHASKGPDYEVFPVRLGGPGADAIVIDEPRNHDKARRLAEELAKFLDLGMRDRSSGQEVAREAGALDQSLRERLRRAGQSVPLPAQPPGARAILRYGGIRSPTTIEIPPMPVSQCARWFLIGILIAGVLAIAFELVARRDGNLAVGVATLIIFLPALVILMPFLIRAAILRERLVVSPDEFVVTRRDVFGTTTSRLAGAEIEEVALNQERGYGGLTSRVVVRSDRHSIELVAALSNPGEVRWLRDVLVHVLTARLE